MKKLLLATALAALAAPVFAQTAFTVNGQTVSVADQQELMKVLADRGVKDQKQQLEAPAASSLRKNSLKKRLKSQYRSGSCRQSADCRTSDRNLLR